MSTTVTIDEEAVTIQIASGVSLAVVDSRIASHAAAIDPHGDRADTTSKITEHDAVKNTHPYLRRLIGSMALQGALIYDDFSVARAAGAINGTPADPGLGARVVADTGNQISISGGSLVIQGIAPAGANPWIHEAGVTRIVGRIAAMRFKCGAGKKASYFGLATSGAAPGPALYKGGTTEDYWSFQFGGGVGASRYLYLYDTCWHEVLFQLRAVGCAFYINYGEGPHLVWISDTDNAAALEMAYRATAADDVDLRLDAWDVPKQVQPLTAIFSDSFNRTDGVLGSTDGAGHAEANGGAGYPWSSNTGTWGVASNAAACSVLSGGIGVATIDAGDPDGYLRVKGTRVGGAFGLVVRYVDASNHYRVYHDGTNLKIDEVYGGTVTNLGSVAVTYSAGKYIWCKCDGVHLRVGYGEASMGGGFGVDFTPIANPIAGARWGLYTTNIGNTFDDCALHPVRVEFQRTNPLVAQSIYCVGDSLTAYLSNYQATLRKLLGDGWCTIDRGVPGYTALKLAARFGELVTRHAPDYVVIEAGINDITAGADAATVESRLAEMYAAAKAAGATVVAVSLSPWKNNASWSAGRQVITDEVNAWILSKPANVDYPIDTYTPLEDPASPDALLAANDSGDHLHLSAIGYALKGTTIHTGATWA